MEDIRNMKFTKVAALVLSLSIAGFSVAACSNEPEPVSSDVNIISTQAQGQNNTATTSRVGYIDDNAESENYVFVYNGVNIVVNTEMDESKFSASDFEVQEDASCAGQGLALLYTFKGGSFTVATAPSVSGPWPISIITLFDDTVTTKAGIYIGQNIDEAKAVYGEPTTATEGAYFFQKGSSQLVFIVDGDGRISSIQYWAI